MVLDGVEMNKAHMIKITWRYFISYFSTPVSIFRYYQDLFIESIGEEIETHIVELGCEKHYMHSRFFPNASNYTCTNVDRDFDKYLDITKMDKIEDSSQDAYLCSSVMEHIEDFDSAIAEITRTLKPGGKLIITVPFMYPIHDIVDYWRFGDSFFEENLKAYNILQFVHLGARLSCVACLLQHPAGKLTKRHLFHKVIGYLALLLSMFFDTPDQFPIGFGIYAEKKY
jgi:SAM-dependent methyltransferase